MAGPVVSLEVSALPEARERRLKDVKALAKWVPVAARVMGWKPYALLGVFDADLVTFAPNPAKALWKMLTKNGRTAEFLLDPNGMFSETLGRDVFASDVVEVPADNLVSFLMGE